MFTQDAGDQEVEPVCPLAGEQQGGGARHVLPGHCQLTPLPQNNVRYHGRHKEAVQGMGWQNYCT